MTERAPTASEVAEGMANCASWLSEAIDEAQSLLDEGAQSTEIEGIATALERVQRRAKKMGQRAVLKCEVCGEPIPIARQVQAESRGQVARYDTTTCRETARKRRQRRTQ